MQKAHSAQFENYLGIHVDGERVRPGLLPNYLDRREQRGRGAGLGEIIIMFNFFSDEGGSHNMENLIQSPSITRSNAANANANGKEKKKENQNLRW
jgi:hypothetical protein